MLEVQFQTWCIFLGIAVQKSSKNNLVGTYVVERGFSIFASGILVWLCGEDLRRDQREIAEVLFLKGKAQMLNRTRKGVVVLKVR